MFPNLGFFQNPVDEDDVGVLTLSSLRWYAGDFPSIGIPEQVGHDNHAIRG